MSLATWAAAILVVVGFLGIVRLLRVPMRVGAVGRQVRSAIAILRDRARSDLDKERALRAHAGRLFGLGAMLVALAAVAVAVPLGVVGLLDLAGLVSLRAVFDLTLRPPFWLLALAIGFVLGALGRRRPRAPRPAAGVAFENRYGHLDRLLHRFAFASGLAQCGLADLEDRWFRRELAAVEPGPPVLVTALPRAGTTILVELLAATSTFATHTYRDLPFVLCPMLWQSLSRHFRRTDAPRERMHGDGIEVSLDSPAALEEVVWKRFWPQQYRRAAIDVWPSCAAPEFVAFFASHRRKIIALRARAKPTARRYLSKNNLNIARLPAIWEAVPAATLVVMFREPLQQAASLLRQHRRFAAAHARDGFSRRYMADLGHFDFGANLEPVDFGGWVGDRQGRDPDRLAFWLDYWCATYRHVLRYASHERLLLIGFDSLVGAADLGVLAERLGSVDPDELRQHGRVLRAPVLHEVVDAEVSPPALEEARALYARLTALRVL